MKQRIQILIITLLGLSLRLYNLGYHDLWYDETQSIFISNYYSPSLSNPFFYIILRFWIKIFGQSEFSVRFPALIFSALSIPSIYILGKKLFSSKVGVIAAIILTLSPFQIWYAQEARHYSSGVFFSIASTYFLVMLINGGFRYWLYFIISSVLGLYSGEFYLVLLIAHIFLFFIYILPRLDKNKTISLLAPLFLAFFCLLPWFIGYLQSFHYITEGFWIPQPSISSLKITFENFLAGYNLSYIHYLIVDFLILLTLFFALKSIYINKDKTFRNNLYICLFLIAFPIISIYIFSKFIFPVYIDRGLIIFSPYFYILLALGLMYLTKRKVGILAWLVLFFLFFIGIKNFYLDYMPLPFNHHMGTYIKKPVKPLIKFMEENARHDDMVAFTNHSTLPSFKLYSKKPRRYYEFFDPALPNTDTDRPIKESAYIIPKQKVPLLKAKRIWVIASNWSHDGGLDEQSKSVKNYLDKKMILGLSENIDGNWIFLYLPK